MRAIPVLLLALPLALAGCSDDGATDDADPSEPAGSATTQTGAPASAVPVVEAVPIDAAGDLGRFVRACPGVDPACQQYVLAARAADFFVERPGANLTGMDLTLSWTAESELTRELGIRAMVMEDWDGCKFCAPTDFERVEGTSPLRYTLAGLAHPLTEQFYVHILVYDPDGRYAAGTTSVMPSTGQPFSIEGTVLLEAPA